MNRDMLEAKFFDVLLSHNHELVMSGVYLDELAKELADVVADDFVPANGIIGTNHCNPVNGVHASWCTGHETASH